MREQEARIRREWLALMERLGSEHVDEATVTLPSLGVLLAERLSGHGIEYAREWLKAVGEMVESATSNVNRAARRMAS